MQLFITQKVHQGGLPTELPNEPKNILTARLRYESLIEHGQVVLPPKHDHCGNHSLESVEWTRVI